MDVNLLKKLLSEQTVSNPYNKWIEWVHISKGLTHCETCLSLDKCWFVNIKKPKLPQHENCHCTIKAISNPIAGVNVTAYCPIEKFIGYIFSDEYAGNGKKVLFEKLGFTLADSEKLKEEFEKQAQEKYASGDYTLGKLNKHGQRINIEIIIQREFLKPVSFISGWMVNKFGNIRNTTPLGG